jgi:SnoaL-like domain
MARRPAVGKNRRIDRHRLVQPKANRGAQIDAATVRNSIGPDSTPEPEPALLRTSRIHASGRTHTRQRASTSRQWCIQELARALNHAQNPTDTLVSFFTALDQLDAGAMVDCCSDGVALVDEISRCWLRGHAEVEAYLLKTLAATETVESLLGDFHCEQQGETAWITAWLEQTYTFAGKQQTITAPTTAVLRLEGCVWKLALLHALPLAAEA